MNIQHTSSEHFEGHGRRLRGQAGMTLLEVMVGLGLMTVIAVGFLYSAMSTVRLNKLTELAVSGTNVSSGQLEAVLGAALDNKVKGISNATGVLLYLSKIHQAVEGRTDYPIRVAMSDEGTLLYEFPVPEPGRIPTGGYSASWTLERQQYDLGVGLMEIYLVENDVPEAFYTWDDLTTGNNRTPVNKNFFDIDGDQEGGGDFRNLFNSPTALINSGSRISDLPVRITVRYYANKKDMATDRNELLPGFKKDYDSSLVSVTREYIINDFVVASNFYSNGKGGH